MRLALFVSCAIQTAARGVNWYVASSNIEGNTALLSAHGASVSGAYLCCNFAGFTANGSFTQRFSDAASAAQIAVFAGANAEVWAVGGVDEAAVHSGAWAAGLPAAARAAPRLLAAGLEGIIIDYEPADNYTDVSANKASGFCARANCP